MSRASTTRRPPAGFTLVEVAVVLTVMALLLGVALPATFDSLTRGRRTDGIAALQRLQLAQERHRVQHGVYAAELKVLGAASATRSDGGLYDIVLQEVQPQAYRAEAQARADGPQSRDSACPQITLQVDDGQPRLGPTPACWNR